MVELALFAVLNLAPIGRRDMIHCQDAWLDRAGPWPLDGLRTYGTSRLPAAGLLFGHSNDLARMDAAALYGATSGRNRANRIGHQRTNVQTTVEGEP